MSTPQAINAINTLIQLGDGSSPPNWTTFANVGDISPALGLSATVVDVTSHSNVDAYRRKQGTLLDPGSTSFKLYFVPGDAGHQAMLALFDTRAISDFRIKFPEVGAPAYHTRGQITKFSITAMVAGVIEAAVDITNTGRPDFNYTEA